MAAAVIRAFSDDSLERDLERRGYAVLPLLDAGEVAAILDAYERIRPPALTPFHATVHTDDPPYREAVYSAIVRVIEAPVRRLVSGYRLCVANFVVKEPNTPGSMVPMHQDWSFVDETKFRAVLIWCPLVDVGPDNGCLAVVRGSHRLSTDPRANNDPHPFAVVLPRLGPYLDEVPLKAGEALFYDGRLLHGSRSNRTNRRRVSIGCVLAPPEAPLLHAYRISPAEVEQYEVASPFFFRHRPGDRPVGVPSAGVTAAPLRQYAADVLARLDAP
jgi:hypothetical protein